jgi:methionine-rich copper-binding protein CopC
MLFSYYQSMNTKHIALIVVTVFLISSVGYLSYAFLSQSWSNQDTIGTKVMQPEETNDSSNSGEQTDFNFDPVKKSAHYVNNVPAHASVLNSAPDKVTITFNFDLSPSSSISVIKDGKEVSTGATLISQDKLVLTKAISSQSAGLYTVKYNACWPDGSCHDGQFQFGVKSE